MRKSECNGMEKADFSSKQIDNDMKTATEKNAASGGVLYCTGFIGAAVYYISHATGFWIGVLGFFKALVWPAFLVYEVFERLQIQ